MSVLPPCSIEPDAQVDPRRAQDRFGIDAVMAIELAILDDLECFGQQWWHFGRRDDDAIFAVDRKDAADQERVESEERNLVRHRSAADAG